jgi:hypothetical protein
MNSAVCTYQVQTGGQRRTALNQHILYYRFWYRFFRIRTEENGAGSPQAVTLLVTFYAMRIFSVCAILFTLLLGCLSGCKRPATLRERPSSVPQTAIWSGGGDGGAWFDCKQNSSAHTTDCAIYSDRDGTLLIRARYQLAGTKRGATVEEFRDPYIDRIPNATTIYLARNKELLATEVLYVQGINEQGQAK